MELIPLAGRSSLRTGQVRGGIQSDDMRAGQPNN